MKYAFLILVLLLIPFSFADVTLHPRSQELADMLNGLDTSALGEKTAIVYIDDVFAGCVTTGNPTIVVLEECEAGFDAFFSENAVKIL